MHARVYGAVLRRPRIGSLLVAAFITRTGQASIDFVLILAVAGQRNSFAAAGAVLGALAAAAAVAGPTHGKLMDRHGPRRVLVAGSILHLIALGMLLLALHADVPLIVLLVLAVTLGAARPYSSTATRSELNAEFGDEPIIAGGPPAKRAALTLDALIGSVGWAAGPALAAALLPRVGASLLVTGAGVTFTAGCLLIARRVSSQGTRASQASRLLSLSVLASRPLRLLAGTQVLGFAADAGLAIAVTAFAASQGSASSAGVLLAVYLLGMTAGTAWRGARPRQRSTHHHIRVILMQNTVVLALLLAAPSLVVAAVLLTISGMVTSGLSADVPMLAQQLCRQDQINETLSTLAASVNAGAVLGRVTVGAVAAISTTAGFGVVAVSAAGAAACAWGCAAAVDQMRTEPTRELHDLGS